MGNRVLTEVTDFTPAQAGFHESRLKVLNDHFLRMIDEGKLQSGSYCLSRNNMIFANNAMGKLSFDKEDDRPFRPDSIYGIYSITKLVTAVAILQLVENGRIRLDQSVGDILEEFNTPPFNEIQIVHLLTHTSGIYYDSGAKPNKYHDSFWHLVKEDSWIEDILKGGLENKPGKEWLYSTAGYVILGEIITRVTKQHCHDYITENILIPCEMFDTSWAYDSSKINRYNLRFQWTKDILDEVSSNPEPPQYKSKMPATGNGLLSTNRDVMNFGLMLLNDGKFHGRHILGRKAVEAMRREHTLPGVLDYCWGAGGKYKGYGLGPEIMQASNLSQIITPKCISHEGWGTCSLVIDFKERFVAVWCAQFAGDSWYSEALRNVASIIWSGLE